MQAARENIIANYELRITNFNSGMFAMRKIPFLLLVAAIFMTGCIPEEKNGLSKLEVPIETGQHGASLSREVKMEMEYLLYLPDAYGKNDKAWPLMVFLHGAGERGDDLELVKVHGPAMIAEINGELPFIIVSPQCPKGLWWPNQQEKVIALIDETVEKYNVDESRIYLTGLSMGGYGSWSIGCTYPERFAAIVPICGGGQPFIAGNLKDVPVWAFHGAKDNVVPLKKSEEMIKAAKQAGGDAKSTVYPQAGHNSWTKTYNNPELYKWLLSHSKNNKQR
jgi:predicted peptidase